MKRKNRRQSNKPDAPVLRGSPLNPPEGAMTGFWKRDWFLVALLIIATVIAYWPALHGGFIWDDDAHISNEPALRSLKGLYQIWFQPGATMQYYPLSFSVFWADYHLWGLNTFGYHLQNVLLHGLAAVLLWQILKRLQVPGALLAGAIFALHPVNVMSVAWMTELKNTLSGTMMLLAAWAYLRFARLGVYHRDDIPGKNAAKIEWRFYFLALVLFQLALLAKTAISILPATLLLIVWWQRKRLRWRDIWPVIPMLGMAIAIGQVTSYVEHHSGGASGEEFKLAFLERLLVSGRSFWFYLGKIFFPYELTFIYPRWHLDVGAWWQYIYPAATIGMFSGLWWMRLRIGRGPFAAMLHFYIGTSFLIFLLVLFMTRYSFVTDHWQYFGCMSVMTLAAAGITKAVVVFGKKRLLLKTALCGSLLLTLGTLTWRQSRMYGDIETLWLTTLDRNPDSWMAHNNLGNILLQKGSAEDAITHFQKALKIKPDYIEAHNNLGNALFQKGSLDDAIIQYRLALQINPDFADAHINLGIALVQKGNVDEAIAHYQQALRINPYDAAAHNDLGVALHQIGKVDEAITHYRQSLQTKPDYAEASYNLGSALLQKGGVDEAIAQFQMTLRINPNYAKAHYKLGTTLLQKGDIEQAIVQYQSALQINPSYPEARNNLAWVLATAPQASQRNGKQAVELAQQANQLAGEQNPTVLRILAAAYAEAGRFDDAKQSAQQAIELARAAGQTNLMNQISAELKFYTGGLPYHQ